MTSGPVVTCCDMTLGLVTDLIFLCLAPWSVILFPAIDTVECHSVFSAFGAEERHYVFAFGTRETILRGFGTEVPFPKPVDGFRAQVLEMHIQAEGRQVWSM